MKVTDLLQERKIDFKVSGRDFLVKCLNPDHEDKNPSMRIDNITGIFNCFSCGYKGNIFKLFGAPSNYLDIKRQNLKDAIEEKRASSVGLNYPKGSVPYVGKWRNIKPETYKHFGAFLHHDSQFIGRIIFPIKDITGKIVAFNGRHQTIGEKPKYMFYPPQAKLPLYPSKVKPIKGRVILVEGIFDMINLFDKGLYNAICCFGTNNVNIDKLSILKLQDIVGIDIVFDPDNAGQKAAQDILYLSERVELIGNNVNLLKELSKPEAEMYIDPGSLRDLDVKILKEKLYG